MLTVTIEVAGRLAKIRVEGADNEQYITLKLEDASISSVALVKGMTITDDERLVVTVYPERASGELVAKLRFSKSVLTIENGISDKFRLPLVSGNYEFIFDK